MNLHLSYNTRHLFILGAGASTEYGLPTWAELSALIKTKLAGELDAKYIHKKEIAEWLNKVDPDSSAAYKTIDECIKHESVKYHKGGDIIENEIFMLIQEIFDEKYRSNEDGWIRLLNDAALRKIKLGSEIAFINYNYDNVLDKNFLKYEHLGDKERNILYANALEEVADTSAQCLHPHGFFSLGSDHNLDKQTETIKTDKERYLDVVSCYESKPHVIFPRDQNNTLTIYILGLGGGLEINLKNLDLTRLRFVQIHITNRHPEREADIKKFLIQSLHANESQIQFHTNCKALIQSCFSV